MKKVAFILAAILAMASLSLAQGQLTVPSSALDVTWGSASTVTTTIATTGKDTSDALNISGTYYQSVQWQVTGTTPRLKIEVWTSMVDVDSMYVLTKTVEDSTTEATTKWSAPVSLKIAGAYFRRYVVTGLATNGADTVFRIKEYLINLPQSR